MLKLLIESESSKTFWLSRSLSDIHSAHWTEVLSWMMLEKKIPSDRHWTEKLNGKSFKQSQV